MSNVQDNGGIYAVECSTLNAQALARIQRQAKHEGRGPAVLAAIRAIWTRLTYDPRGFGEPLYQLPNLNMRVRTGATGPLVVIYGVHDRYPIVFIKFVRLLPLPDDYGAP